MSRTTPVRCGDTMLWAYDVALGVLFTEAARVAEESGTVAQQPSSRLALVRWLRTGAVAGSDFAVLLDELDGDQRRLLPRWIAEASARLTARGGVGSAEVAGWDVPGGEPLDLRGADHLAAAPLAELAEALSQLLTGTLPPTPAGRHWYAGAPSGRTTL